MHKALTPRERVRSALEHRQPDRVPIDFGGPFSGIHVTAYQNLIKYLGLNEPVVIIDPVQQLALPSETVLCRLNVDTRYLWPKPPASFKATPILHNSDGQTRLEFTDEWGVTWSAPADNPHHYDVLISPMAHLSPAEIKDYPFPRGDDPARFEGLRQTAVTLRRETDCAIVCGTPASIVEIYRNLRGTENLYTDMVTNQELFETVADRILGFWLDWFSLFLDQVGDLVDVILLADDLAGQHGPLFSPELYRRLIKPRHTLLIRHISSRTPAKICYHSCGAVTAFIPDLIEAGIRILNPIQLSAKGMDPADLKTRYATQLTLWGGAIDAQLLPCLTPNQIRENVALNLYKLKPGGGYMFAPEHNIQADVPPENILAMFDAVVELGRY